MDRRSCRRSRGLIATLALPPAGKVIAPGAIAMVKPLGRIISFTMEKVETATVLFAGQKIALMRCVPMARVEMVNVAVFEAPSGCVPSDVVPS